MKKLITMLMILINILPFITIPAKAAPQRTVLDCDESSELCVLLLQELSYNLDEMLGQFGFEITGAVLNEYTYEELLNDKSFFEKELIKAYMMGENNEQAGINIRKYSLKKTVYKDKSGVPNKLLLDYTVTYGCTLSELMFVKEHARSKAALLTVGLTSEYEKAKAVHDYIVENFSYDGTLPIEKAVTTAYRMIETKKGICTAFSSLFYELLTACGIEAKIIYVDAYANGQSHAWNMIKIENNWYHADVTWDAYEKNDKYFLISNAKILKDHQFDALLYNKAQSDYTVQTVLPVPAAPAAEAKTGEIILKDSAKNGIDEAIDAVRQTVWQNISGKLSAAFTNIIFIIVLVSVLLMTAAFIIIFKVIFNGKKR